MHLTVHLANSGSFKGKGLYKIMTVKNQIETYNLSSITVVSLVKSCPVARLLIQTNQHCLLPQSHTHLIS